MGEWDNLQHHLFSPARASTEPQGRMNRGYLFSFMISEVSASKSNSILYKRLFGWARACLKRSLELRFTVHADSSSRTDGDDGGRAAAASGQSAFRPSRDVASPYFPIVFFEVLNIHSLRHCFLHNTNEIKRYTATKIG